MSNAIFYVLSAIVVLSALMAVTQRNLYHCSLYLVLSLFGTAGVFLYLGQEFLAAVQILIYVGAVTVLLIFGIMLTRQVMDARVKTMNKQVGMAFVVSAGMVLAMVKAFGHGVPRMTSLGRGQGAGWGGDVGSLGLALLRPDQGFVFAFELLSFLLLSALVGAIVVARKEND